MCFSSSWARPNHHKKQNTARLVQRQTITTKHNTLDVPTSALTSYINPRYTISSSFFEQNERHRRQKDVMEEIDFVQTLTTKLAPARPVPKPSGTEQKLIDEMGKLTGWIGKKDREEEMEKATRKARSDGEEAARKEYEIKQQQEGLTWCSSGRGPLSLNGSGTGHVMIGAGPTANGPVTWYGHFNVDNHGPSSGLRGRNNTHTYDPYAPPIYYSSPRRRSSASSVYKAVAQKIIHKVDVLAKDIEKVGDRVKDLGWKERRDREKDDLEEELRHCKADREREMERYFYERNRRDFDIHIGASRYGGVGKGRRSRDCGCGYPDGREREGARFS